MPDNINWAALFTQFPGLQQAVAQIQPQQAQQPGMVSDWGTGGQPPAWRGLAHWGQRAAGYLAGRPADQPMQGFTPRPLPGYGDQPQFPRPQPRTVSTQFPRPQIDPSIVGNVPQPMAMQPRPGMANAQPMGTEAMPSMQTDPEVLLLQQLDELRRQRAMQIADSGPQQAYMPRPY